MVFKYLLEIESISYKVGDNFINNDITFNINSGDLVSIVGPNGSGKSTLVRLLSGDINPTVGRVLFLSKSINNWDINSLAKKRAILSQSNALTFPFSVFDIITMGRFPYNKEGKLNSEEMDYCYSLIDIFDLSNLILSLIHI